SAEMKQLAVDALNAIPGLTHGAVDLMIETTTEGKEKGFIIELNTTAQLGGILFPLKGTPRDVHKAIIDYYFPETKGVETDKEKIYFDLNEAIYPLKEMIANTSTVSQLPTKDFQSKRISLRSFSGTLHDLLWIKNIVKSYSVTGLIRQNKKLNIEIILIG